MVETSTTCVTIRRASLDFRKPRQWTSDTLLRGFQVYIDLLTASIPLRRVVSSQCVRCQNISARRMLWKVQVFSIITNQC